MGVAMGAIFVGIGVVGYNVLDIVNLNTKMNNIQNEFYRFVVITQIYFPTLLTNYQLSSSCLTPEDHRLEKELILKEITYIE